jgi:hypothetical protein
MINLALAVISDSFDNAQAEEKQLQVKEANDKQKQEARKAREKAEKAENEAEEAKNNKLISAPLSASPKSRAEEAEESQLKPGNADELPSDINAHVPIPGHASPARASNLLALKQDVADEQKKAVDQEAEKVLQAHANDDHDVVVGSRCWRLKATVFKLVESAAFGGFIMLLIIVNTVLLSIEYHDQDIFEQAWVEELEKNTSYVQNTFMCNPDVHLCPNNTAVPCYCNFSAVDNTGFVCQIQLEYGDYMNCGMMFSWKTGVMSDLPTMPKSYTDFLENANYFLGACFLAEMLLKLYALGIRGYCRNAFNIFDGCIVLSSVIETIVKLASGGGGGGGFLSVFRAFRLFRIFKLARSWKSLNEILNKLIRALTSIGPLMIVMSLFIFIFALLGMNVFGQDSGFLGNGRHGEAFAKPCIREPCNNPRSNFDRFLPLGGPDGGHGAAATIFQILTGENWNNVLYDGMSKAGWPLALFFVCVIVIGDYLLMNLFLAILLSGFGAEEPADDVVEALVAKKPGRIARLFGFFRRRVLAERDDVDAPYSSQELAWIKISDRALFILPHDNMLRKLCTLVAENKWFDRLVLICIIVGSVFMAVENPRDDKGAGCCGQRSDAILIFAKFDVVFVAIFTFECVLKIVAYGFFFRSRATEPRHDPYLRSGWNLLDFFVVCISLINLMGTTGSLRSLRTLRTFRSLRPLRIINRNPNMKLVVNCLLASIPSMFNVVLVCLLFYLIFSILFLQFFRGQFWYCAGKQAGSATEFSSDFTLVKDMEVHNWQECKRNPEYTWIQYDAHFDNVLFAFQSLFEVSSLEGWQTVLDHAIDKAGMPGVMPLPNKSPGFPTILFIFFIFFCAFFVLNLFVGVVIDNYNDLKSKADDDGGTPLNEDQKEWVKTVKRLLHMKARKKLKPPQHKLRFLVFRFVTHKFFDAFILSAICSNVLVMMLRTYVWDGQTTGCRLYQECTYDSILDILSKIFSYIFIFEAVVKLISFGPKQYFGGYWNRVDFCLVLLSIPQLITAALPPFFSIFRVLRISRLVRRFKGVRRQIQVVLMSWPSLINVGGLLFLVFSIYSVLSVQLFWNVKPLKYINQHAHFKDFWTAFFTLFRMVTGENWEGIMHDCTYGVCAECIRDPDDLTLFDNVWTSACTQAGSVVGSACRLANSTMGSVLDSLAQSGLLLVDDALPTVTGLGLADLVSADVRDLIMPCGTGITAGCGNSVLGVGVFSTFYIIASLLMLNLFIAVILDNDKAAKQEDEKGLQDEVFEHFVDIWSIFDPEATNLLPTKDLGAFMKTLDKPLGLGARTHTLSLSCTLRVIGIHARRILSPMFTKPNGDVCVGKDAPEIVVRRRLRDLQIQDHTGVVYFLEVSPPQPCRLTDCRAAPRRHSLKCLHRGTVWFGRCRKRSHTMCPSSRKTLNFRRTS